MALPYKLAVGLGSVILEKATYHSLSCKPILESVRFWSPQVRATNLVLYRGLGSYLGVYETRSTGIFHKL
jgi:hypothetical protein